MEDLAAALLPWARLAVIALFTGLALVAVVAAPRSGSAGWWAAATFGSLAVALLGGWIPEAFGMQMPAWVGDVRIVLILAFPYLLLRFTASFRRLPRGLEVAAAAAAVAVVVATLALPPLPEADPRPQWASVYVAGALAYWVLVSLVTVVRLWHAGRGQPTVARRRLRLMSAAAAVLTVALLVAGQGGDASALVPVAVQLTAVAGAVIFGLGFRPPRAFRLLWRRPEEEHLRRATMAVLRAVTVDDVAGELLAPTVRLVGGGGAAIVNPEGRVAAAYGDAPETGTELGDAAAGSPDGPARNMVPLGEDRGHLVVWTSPYTPFFGREEVDLLHAMGAVASLALERCELVEDERAQRIELEQAQHDAEQARDDASRANTAKTEFLSRMSHELRTPLNAILGFGQLLETSRPGAEDTEAVKYILKAGRHLLVLINDVLDLSRIEAGMLTISLEPVHTAEVINDAVALIQPLADNRSIRVKVDNVACDSYAKTDRQRCRQILLNILSNAVKYNHDGGDVSVHCSALDERTVRVSVRDTGPGIDPLRQQRLFEPFERLGAEASGVEGTGLGLALSKQLAERLGGGMGVETAPGRGATFWIDLPITDRPADDERPETEISTRSSSAERSLLLVEDNMANLRVVEAMLRRRPEISVLPAMQGRIALDLASQHQPDVIVLDLHLPDLSGREVLHRLKADTRTRHIPVVVASADATPGRARQLREDGAFDYLTKPLDLQRFLEVIDAALAHTGIGNGSERPDGPG